MHILPLLTENPVVVEDFPDLHSRLFDEKVEIQFVDMKIAFTLFDLLADVAFDVRLDVTCEHSQSIESMQFIGTYSNNH